MIQDKAKIYINAYKNIHYIQWIHMMEEVGSCWCLWVLLKLMGLAEVVRSCWGLWVLLKSMSLAEVDESCWSRWVLLKSMSLAEVDGSCWSRWVLLKLMGLAEVDGSCWSRWILLKWLKSMKLDEVVGLFCCLVLLETLISLIGVDYSAIWLKLWAIAGSSWMRLLMDLACCCSTINIHTIYIK